MNSADVKAFFERVSVEWDEMRSTFYNAGVIDALAERTGADATTVVVDVGTGTGFIAAGLAPRVASLIAVDNSAAMLAVARKNLDALKVTNVTLREGELDALPLADGSADIAVANMVLHHAPDPALMLSEMGRVVRPGGMVAITDAVEHPHEWMRIEQADIWLGFTPTQIDTFFTEAHLSERGYVSLGMQ